CLPAPSTPSQCDLNNVIGIKSDAHGAISTPFTVHRTLLTPQGLTDCASKPCVMLAAPGSDFTKHATTPISFAASGGPAPRLKATPATKLLHHQKVNVAGAGFRPGSQVLVGECLANQLALGCGTVQPAKANASGTIATTYAVSRVLYNTAGTR